MTPTPLAKLPPHDSGHDSHNQLLPFRPVKGIEFESRGIHQMRFPYLVADNEWDRYTEFGARVWADAVRAMSELLDRGGDPLHRYYGPEFSVLSDANPGLEPAWMRLDLAWNADGDPQVLELNSACPGGWSLTAIAATELADTEPDRLAKLASLAPSPTEHARHLVDKLGPRIVIAALFHDYRFELGYVFGRRFLYESSPIEYEPDDTFMVRVGAVY